MSVCLDECGIEVVFGGTVVADVTPRVQIDVGLNTVGVEGAVVTSIACTVVVRVDLPSFRLLPRMQLLPDLPVELSKMRPGPDKTPHRTPGL